MITRKDIFYTVNDMVYGLNESTIKSASVSPLLLGNTALLSENIYNNINESGVNGMNISKTLKDIIIKQQIFEELKLTKTISYFNFLNESLDRISNDNTILLEGDALVQGIAHASTAPIRKSGDDGSPTFGEYGTVAGMTAGLQGARLAIGSARTGGLIGKKLAKDAAAMRKAARAAKGAKTGADAVKAMKAAGNAPKWLTVAGRLFPKLLPKIAGLSAKAAKAVLVAGTAGMWLVIELIIFIAAKGGIKLMTSDTRLGHWCVKKLLKFIEEHPNWVKGINVAWTIVAYGDWKKAVLKKGVEWGYITKKKAQELEVKSNLFGEKYADNYEDEEGEEGQEQTEPEQSQTQQTSQGQEQVTQQEEPDYSNTTIPQVPDKGTMSKIYADIQSTGLVPKNFGNWLVILRNAVNQGKLPGWTTQKIDYYRQMINAAYQAKKQGLA